MDNSVLWVVKKSLLLYESEVPVLTNKMNILNNKRLCESPAVAVFGHFSHTKLHHQLHRRYLSNYTVIDSWNNIQDFIALEASRKIW